MQLSMSHALRGFETEETDLLREHRLRSQKEAEDFKVTLVKLLQREEPTERLEELYEETGEIVREEVEAEQRRQRECLRGVLEKWRRASVKCLTELIELEQRKN